MSSDNERKRVAAQLESDFELRAGGHSDSFHAEVPYLQRHGVRPVQSYIYFRSMRSADFAERAGREGRFRFSHQVAEIHAFWIKTRLSSCNRE